MSPRTTTERQASNRRIAKLRAALTDAIGEASKEDPGLSHAEALCALSLTLERHINRLLDDEPEPRAGAHRTTALECGCG